MSAIALVLNMTDAGRPRCVPWVGCRVRRPERRVTPRPPASQRAPNHTARGDPDSRPRANIPKPTRRLPATPASTRPTRPRARGLRPAPVRCATDAKARCYYAETLPNPKLEVFPSGEVAKIGREMGVPLIMDNTAAPVLCRPLDHGAAVVMHSTTKYIGGHGTSIGGIVVDGGNFDWEQHAERFPLLNQPDPSYHGAVWTQAVKPLGPIAYILKMRVTLLRDLGAPMSPFNAFLFLQGLETLPLRMRAHCANAAAVTKFLSEHPKVTRVIYPNQMTGEMRRRADTYLKGGYGGLVGFELKGGLDAGRRFIDALQMFYHVANIGDARSLAIHPATTTHSQLSPEEQLRTGVDENYVRLSIGIEHEEDILADLKQALEKA